jgi:2-polyprenyl-3-methyl-5-hydroxy-6-metoxy-1,4-benzoquinol methylase
MDRKCCNLCNEKKSVLLYSINNFDIVKCEKCGLVYINDIPSDKELSDIYEENSDILNANVEEAIQRSVFKNPHQKRYKLISKLAKGKLLEIGCGNGEFLKVAKMNDWDCIGVDISKKNCIRVNSNGIKAIQGDICDMDFFVEEYHECFDVVVMWACIEHLKNPKKAIINLHKCIKPGGYLFISTGDIESINAKISGSNWNLLTPPQHLFYFSEKSLVYLLKNTGFEPLSVKHIGSVINNNKSIAKYINYFCMSIKKFGDVIFISAKKKINYK